MKTFHIAGISKLTLCASLVASLAACGGGGSNGDSNGKNTTAGGAGAGSGSAGTSVGSGSGSGTGTGGGSLVAATQITGKAIDGYLAGATVCVDNGQGACDVTQSTTTTDASGNYALSVAGDINGKTIDVLVSATTTDASNNNAPFPNTFVLSAVLQDGKTQNVTPITSLVAAQIKAGRTYAQAATAVQALTGASVDPNADYVANGDSATAALSAKVVTTMQSYAVGGALDRATGRNVLNAIVAVGDPTSVTPAAVMAQANAAATPIDVSSALADPLYVVDDFLSDASPYTAGQNSQSPASSFALRDSYTLANSILAIGQDQRGQPGASWTPVTPTGIWDGYRNTQVNATLFDGVTGVYEMKKDGTWTGFLPNAQLHAPIPLTSVGPSLVGIDPNSGIGYTLQYRQADVGGQPISSAVPFYYSLANGNTARASMKGTFASGTVEYLGNASYAADQVILPVDADTVQTSLFGSDTTPDFGEGLALNGVAISDPNNLGKVGQVYTSVQQIVGVKLGIGVDPETGGAGGTLVLLPNGEFQITSLPVYANYADVAAGATRVTALENVSGTWTTYARNPNVLVLSLPATFNKPIYSQDNVTEAILHGAQFVVALHNGRLKSGFLIPANTAELTPQFTGPVADQIAASLLAAAAQPISPTPVAAAQLRAIGHSKR